MTWLGRLILLVVVVAGLFSGSPTTAFWSGGLAPSQPQIAGVTLSNGTTFAAPATTGTTLDTISANCSVGNCAGATFALATTGACASAANNGSFVVSGTNLNVGASTVNAGSYSIGIAVTLAGATNSGVCFLQSLTGLTTTASLTANPTTITSGASSTLTWSSTNATSCTGTNFSTGGATNNAVGVSVSPTTTTTYSINCSGAVASATVTVTTGGPPVISSTQLSGSAVQFAATAPYYVGTLSTNVTPQTPTFNNLAGSTYQLVASGGSCSGGDTTHFQIIGDSVYTNTIAANLSPGYTLCVTASATGVTPVTTAFTGVTEGHKIDAAATYCAANGGGTGTAASPWTAPCIQAASSAAVKGDTLFLAAGNWALSTASSAGQVRVVPAINIVGAGSGNTLNATGNPNNASGTDLCPTSSTSITCVMTTGSSVVGAPGGWIQYYGCGSTDAAGSGPTGLSHLFIDGSQATAGGDAQGTVNFYSCFTAPETISVQDIRVLAFNNANNISPEAQFMFTSSNNITVSDSILAAPLAWTGPGYAGVSPWFATGGQNFTMKNIYLFEAGQPAISVDNITLTGSTILMDSQFAGQEVFQNGVGFEGCAIGPWVYNCQGSLVGSTGVTFTNNYVNGTGVRIAIGGGLNDPGTGGGENTLVFTGNNMVGGYSAAVDSCVWHYYDYAVPNNPYNPSNTNRPFWGCAPASTGGGAEGMQINGSMNSDCSIAPTPTAPFTVTNNTITATGSAQLDAAGTGGMRCFLANVTGNLSGTTISGITGGAGMAGIVVGSHLDDQTNGANIPQTPTAATVTGVGVAACGTANCVTVNNAMTTATGDLIRFIPPHDNSVVGFNAQKNYLNSPHNLYVSSAASLNETINPTVIGNFCAGGSSFTQTDSTGCATTGFTTAPTASFTIGPLTKILGANAAPFTATNFTAQYGAVQWLASTLQTTPTSGGQTGTGCNGAACSWSNVPPAYMMGATHGSTVYLWTMDSANQISAPASALIP